MTGFLIAAGLLLLIAAALLVRRRPLEPRPADEDDPNLNWYRQRRAELGDPAERGVPDDDSESLLAEAQLRLLEDGSVDAQQQAAPSGGRFPALALFVLLVALCAAIYWRTGSMEDVLIYRELATLRPEDGEEKRLALLRRIEERSLARQDNLQYLSLLGRLHMAGEDFAAASRDFALLAEKAPGDPQALAMAAQARFLASGRQLDSEAQLLAERALAVDPMQRTALGLLGMASFERGAYGAAVSYWERLQELEAPDSPGYGMLAEVMALARERGGLVADTPAPAGETPGISVQLSLGGATGIDPDAVIFVFARSAASDRGMPVAVRRLQASQLPTTLRLSDGDAMAGQLLSEAGEVLVSAQLSSNGQPGVDNALLSGVAGPVSAGSTDASVSIELRPAAERG